MVVNLLPNNLSFQQIESLWTQQGGPSQWAPTMADVALAESSGNPTAIANTAYPNLPNYHPVAQGNLPEYSVGLYQINELAHPGSTTAQLENPVYNTDQAIQILGGGSGIGAWQGDPVGKVATAQGGPLTKTQLKDISNKLPVQPYATVTSNVSNISGAPPSTTQLGALGSILQGIDSFLNPQVSTIPLIGGLGPNQVASAIVTTVDRALASLLFIGMVVGGFYLMFRKSGGSGLMQVYNDYQTNQIRQQRESRQSQQMDLAERRLAESQRQANLRFYNASQDRYDRQVARNARGGGKTAAKSATSEVGEALVAV